MRLRGPVMALLWEQWRNVRGLLVLSVGVALCVALFAYACAIAVADAQLRTWFAYFLGCALVGASAIGLLLDSDNWSGHVRFEIPLRPLRLPVRRAVQFSLHILARLLASAVMAFVFAKMLEAALAGSRFSIPHFAGRLTMIGTMAFASGLAVAWCVARLTKAGCGIAPVLITWCVLALAVFRLKPWIWFGDPYPISWCATMLVLFIVVALANALSFDNAVGVPRVLLRTIHLRRTYRRPRPFRNPLMAHVWYEWKHRSLALPSAVLAGVVLIGFRAFIPGIFNDHVSWGRYPCEIYPCPIVLLPCWNWLPVLMTAFIVGCLFAGALRNSQDAYEFRAGRTPYGRFMPMRTSDRVHARLWTGVGVIALPLLALAICVFIDLDAAPTTMSASVALAAKTSGTAWVGTAWGIALGFALAVSIAAIAAWSAYWAPAPTVAVFAGAAAIRWLPWFTSSGSFLTAAYIGACVVFVRGISAYRYGTANDQTLLAGAGLSLPFTIHCLVTALVLASTTPPGTGYYGSDLITAVFQDLAARPVAASGLCLSGLYAAVVLVRLCRRHVRRTVASLTLAGFVGAIALACAVVLVLRLRVAGPLADAPYATVLALPVLCAVPALATLYQAWLIHKWRCS